MTALILATLQCWTSVTLWVLPSPVLLMCNTVIRNLFAVATSSSINYQCTGQHCASMYRHRHTVQLSVHVVRRCTASAAKLCGMVAG
ncbi:hypothetical protein PF005_g16311 [Phytophthora fragariae]|uniref:Uncharacterized protein n=1 Tax=Phytophthora fragariae TaxID=53985 RepID=A0A6A3L567_9STRA|nr:hypothetical protein PF003_g36896 [Phytophthora fragariae]KAE8939266.1 hypothetical protein PF009_g10886 [Phytophthora fragariae]KAE9013117.1 hypothetical protein PF011_g8615 [Phytophthora fragariae]KAE9109080.1 hypothetical protein PF010_g11673 [Phytophthora fragariae]KAE9133413.1 hypothetical protein PF007_g3366 [Phytophthora fragariae]